MLACSARRSSARRASRRWRRPRRGRRTCPSPRWRYAAAPPGLTRGVATARRPSCTAPSSGRWRALSERKIAGTSKEKGAPLVAWNAVLIAFVPTAECCRQLQPKLGHATSRRDSQAAGAPLPQTPAAAAVSSRG
eukprot:scaffold27015_cov55-Phaeocystis_antarctica.AAC.5